MCSDPPGSFECNPVNYILSLSFFLSLGLSGARSLPLIDFGAFRKRDRRLETEIRCQCGRVYVTAAGLRNHLRWECGKEPSFVCSFPACDYKTHQKGNYRSHLLRVHGIKIL